MALILLLTLVIWSYILYVNRSSSSFMLIDDYNITMLGNGDAILKNLKLKFYKRTHTFPYFLG
jgi:hypothetical protein